MSDLYSCDKCKLFLQDPILLPCGNTVCLQHVSQNRKVYSCGQCNQHHEIPDSGFPFNKKILESISRNEHLTSETKAAKDALDQLDLTINQNKYLLNKDKFIYDYFYEIKAKIESHRDKLASVSREDEIRKIINEKAGDFLSILNENEDYCKINAEQIDNNFLYEFNNEKISKWKLQLTNSSSPSPNSLTIQDIIREIASSKENLELDIQNYKNDLLMHKTYEFISSQNNEVGQLLIKDLHPIRIKTVKSKTSLIDAHSDGITTLLVLKNGDLVSGSWDRMIKVWDLGLKSIKYNLKGHKNSVSSLIELNNGDLASGSYDGSIFVWDLEKKKLRFKLEEHPYFVSSLVVLKNGDLASGAYNGKIFVWNLNKKMKKFQLDGHSYFVTSLILLDNGDLVSSGWDKQIIIWDLENRCKKYKLDSSSYQITDPVTSLILLNNGDLVCGCYNGTIIIWNCYTKSIKYKLRDNVSSVSCFAVLKSGELVSATYNGTIFVWDLNKRSIIYKLKGHINMVWSLAVLTNDDLVSGSHDKSILIWG